MLELSFVRNNFDHVAERLASRGNVTGLDQFRELDRKRRAAISRSEQLKAQVNAESAEIGKLRREGADTAERQERVRAMKSEMGALDEQVKLLDESFRELLAGIPNLPHESVPFGRDAADNVEVRRVVIRLPHLFFNPLPESRLQRHRAGIPADFPPDFPVDRRDGGQE